MTWARAIENGEVGNKRISRVRLEDEDLETDSFKAFFACSPLQSLDVPQ